VLNSSGSSIASGNLSATSSSNNSHHISKRAGFFSSLFNFGKGALSIVFNPFLMGIWSFYTIYEEYGSLTDISKELNNEFSDIIDVSTFYFDPKVIERLIYKNAENPILLKKVAKLNNVCKEYNRKIVTIGASIACAIEEILRILMMVDSGGLSEMLMSFAGKIISALGVLQLGMVFDFFTGSIMSRILEGFDYNKEFLIKISTDNISKFKQVEPKTEDTEEAGTSETE
jgi:hypothetical protein